MTAQQYRELTATDQMLLEGIESAYMVVSFVHVWYKAFHKTWTLQRLSAIRHETIPTVGIAFYPESEREKARCDRALRQLVKIDVKRTEDIGS